MATAKLGDYVLASKYSDRDPQDPWRVGFVCRIIRTWEPMAGGILTYVIGNQNGTWADFREYRHCKRITPSEGRDWIARHGGKPAAPAGKGEEHA